MRADHLEAIKQFEGFSPGARWDYAQHTNGYGTAARYPGEQIGRTEAEHRFAAEIAKAREAVARFAPHLDEGTAAALTSLTFNTGQRWMKDGLGRSIASGDIDAAREIFKQYVHAGSLKLPGLVARRALEAQWIGAQQAANAVAELPETQGATDRARLDHDTASPPDSTAANTNRSFYDHEPERDVASLAPRADGGTSPRLPGGGLALDLARALLAESLTTILVELRARNARERQTSKS